MISRLGQHLWRSSRTSARHFPASTYSSTNPTLTPSNDTNTQSIRNHHSSLTISNSTRHPVHNAFSASLSHLYRSPFVHDGLLVRNFSTTATNPQQTEPKRDQPPNDSYVMNLTVRESNIIKPSPSDRRTTPSDHDAVAKTEENMAELGLFKRFKVMFKKYWYVMLPVHVVTSTGWIVGFYYMSKSGVDVPELLRAISVSESIVEKIQNSPTGHLAIAYLCYKIATPVRYTVTLGGTTVSIKYLAKWGYIKPMPSAARIAEIYVQNADKMKRGYEDFQDKAKSALQGEKKNP